MMGTSAQSTDRREPPVVDANGVDDNDDRNTC